MAIDVLAVLSVAGIAFLVWAAIAFARDCRPLHRSQVITRIDSTEPQGSHGARLFRQSPAHFAVTEDRVVVFHNPPRRG